MKLISTFMLLFFLFSHIYPMGENPSSIQKQEQEELLLKELNKSLQDYMANFSKIQNLFESNSGLINSKDDKGRSLFMQHIDKNPLFVNWLINRKGSVFDPNHQDNEGFSLLHYITMASYRHKDDMSPYLEMLKSVLNKNGININLKNTEGNTPLHSAVFYANYDIIKLLIDHGADPTIKNNKNQTPEEIDLKEWKSFIVFQEKQKELALAQLALSFVSL